MRPLAKKDTRFDTHNAYHAINPHIQTHNAAELSIANGRRNATTNTFHYCINRNMDELYEHWVTLF